jgi:RHS repeat-associated protein
VRPDGKTVEFGYDALGRRVWKKYGAKTTKWIWDGNVPVHEWVEVGPELVESNRQQAPVETDGSLVARKFMLTKRFAQGPPPDALGTASAPITWVFEPESFAPLAKLSAAGRYAIVTDHLGTPTAMLDEQGAMVWSAEIDVYGRLQNVVGEKAACPFRWPGQYEDEETGLYYNRFRYYDAEAGRYICQDPIGLNGGPRPYGYPKDVLLRADPWGLSDHCPDDEKAKARASLLSILRTRIRQLAGFSNTGTPLILDENVMNRGLAEGLRARGYDVRSVVEVFGKTGVDDETIRSVANSVGGRVITNNVKDFGRDVAIPLPRTGRWTPEGVAQFIEYYLK